MVLIRFLVLMLLIVGAAIDAADSNQKENAVCPSPRYESISSLEEARNELCVSPAYENLALEMPESNRPLGMYANVKWLGRNNILKSEKRAIARISKALNS